MIRLISACLLLAGLAAGLTAGIFALLGAGRPARSATACSRGCGRRWTNCTGPVSHRSPRAANVMADPAGRLTIVDFSFSELDATRRQMDLDVAELLASTQSVPR